MQNILAASLFSGSLWQIVSNTSAFGVFILAVLLFMSVTSWVIIFYKWRQFRVVEKDSRRFMQQFRRTKQIAEAVGQAKASPNSPFSKIFSAGYGELISLKELRHQGGPMQEKVSPLSNDDFELIEMTMDKTMIEEVGYLERKVIFLATTANSAPFMGLLGTVVGIMDSFWAIGERGSASLAVVAPGIAEALLATIVGLGAAIPAVMAYNWANNKTKYLHDFAGNFILEFLTAAKKENR